MNKRPLAAVAAAVVLPTTPVEAKHDGCNTDPCEKRVAERFTPATASWYGPGLASVQRQLDAFTAWRAAHPERIRKPGTLA